MTFQSSLERRFFVLELVLGEGGGLMLTKPVLRKARETSEMVALVSVATSHCEYQCDQKDSFLAVRLERDQQFDC